MNHILSIKLYILTVFIVFSVSCSGEHNEFFSGETSKNSQIERKSNENSLKNLPQIIPEGTGTIILSSTSEEVQVAKGDTQYETEKSSVIIEPGTLIVDTELEIKKEYGRSLEESSSFLPSEYDLADLSQISDVFYFEASNQFATKKDMKIQLFSNVYLENTRNQKIVIIQEFFDNELQKRIISIIDSVQIDDSGSLAIFNSRYFGRFQLYILKLPEEPVVVINSQESLNSSSEFESETSGLPNENVFPVITDDDQDDFDLELDLD